METQEAEPPPEVGVAKAAEGWAEPRRWAWPPLTPPPTAGRRWIPGARNHSGGGGGRRGGMGGCAAPGECPTATHSGTHRDP